MQRYYEAKSKGPDPHTEEYDPEFSEILLLARAYEYLDNQRKRQEREKRMATGPNPTKAARVATCAHSRA